MSKREAAAVISVWPLSSCLLAKGRGMGREETKKRSAGSTVCHDHSLSTSLLLSFNYPPSKGCFRIALQPIGYADNIHSIEPDHIFFFHLLLLAESIPLT